MRVHFRLLIRINYARSSQETQRNYNAIWLCGAVEKHKSQIFLTVLVFSPAGAVFSPKSMPVALGRMVYISVPFPCKDCKMYNEAGLPKNRKYILKSFA